MEKTENVQQCLAADDNGTYRVFLLDELRSHNLEVIAHLNAGLVPNEYEKFAKLQKALQAAITVVEQFKA